MKTENFTGMRNANQLQTLNGNCLELHPIHLELKVGEVKNDLRYLWHLGPSYFRANVYTYKNAQLQAFTENAFLLWLCRDVVFADSRLFLATVFAGNSVFPGSHLEDMYPTLGAMLEWWEKCKDAHIKPFGVDELMFRYQGGGPVAPKECYSVNVLGNIGKRDSSSFWGEWRQLKEINQRYHSLRANYEAHSMERVVRIISKKCPDKMYIVEKWRHKVDVAYWVNEATTRLVEAEENEHLYYTALIDPHRQKLLAMDTRYKELHKEARDIKAEYSDLEALVRSHKMTQEELLAQWLPLKKKRSHLFNQARNLLFSTLKETFPNLVKSYKDAKDLYPRIEKHLCNDKPIIINLITSTYLYYKKIKELLYI